MNDHLKPAHNAGFIFMMPRPDSACAIFYSGQIECDLFLLNFGTHNLLFMNISLKFSGISFLALLLFTGCKSKWEYKTTVVSSTLARDGDDAFKQSMLIPSDDDLNKLGKEGWELVSVTPETETAWPNFGKSDYVLGIQPNIRTLGCVLLFKRKITPF